MASLARYFSAVSAPQEYFFSFCPSPTSHNTAVKCYHLCMPDVWRLCSPIRHSVVAAKFHVVLRWYFRYSADPPRTNNPYVSLCAKDRKVTSLLKKFNTIIFRNIPDYHAVHYKIESFAAVSSAPSPQKKIGEKDVWVAASLLVFLKYFTWISFSEGGHVHRLRTFFL